MRALWIPAIMALVLSQGQGMGEALADEAEPHAVPFEHLQSLGDLRYHDFRSAILERGFHIYVSLPEEREEGETYPVMVVLDGGGLLPLLAGQNHYLWLGQALPKIVLVGISYGSPYFQDGNLRSTDFTAPSEERDYWGGAGAFQTMLADELLPFIEASYPIDPDQRFLFGQSLGGQFVLYSALTRPSLFHGRIASNPALHRNLPFFLEWQGQGDMPPASGRLFVSSGEFDAEQFRGPFEQWVDHWTSMDELPWMLEVRTLRGQTHFSAAAESFTQGLRWIFEAEP